MPKIFIVCCLFYFLFFYIKVDALRAIVFCV